MPHAPITSTTIARLAIAGTLLLGAGGAATAEAAPATSAVCTGLITLHISPGFDLRPGAGVVGSGGETGTVRCAGTLEGRLITGRGTFSVEETYASGGGCLSDRSSGTVSTTLPTTGGPLHLVGALTARRIGLVEFIDIEFPRARFSATGVVVPVVGTCATTPLTRALLSVTGVLSGR